jgi:hypothetical protein
LPDLIEKNFKHFHDLDLKIHHEKHRLILTNVSIDSILTLTMSNSLALVLGLTSQISTENFHISIENKHTASYKSKIHLLRPDYILVYADFIENSIVGGILAPVLKVIPALSTDSNSSDRMYYDFQGQSTVSLCKDILSTFCIELRDVTGKLLEFDPEEYTEILVAFKENV